MITFIQLYIPAIISMALFDIAWLHFTTDALYKKYIGHLLADSFSLTPGIFFYIIYIFGLTFLVLYPGILNNLSFKHIILSGAVFGMAAYATFDLTSQAVFKGWTTNISLIDIVWGTLMTATVTSISLYVYSHLA